MIRIVRGPESERQAYFARLGADADRALWLLGRPDAHRSWAVFRNLHRQIRDRLGPGTVDAALGRHRVGASLVFQELADDLTPRERSRSERLAARLDSHLTHNWIVQRPLREGMARLLFELLDGRGWCLLAPDLQLLDVATIEVLWTLHRLYPDRLPDIVMGYPSRAPEPPPDEHGLVWQISRESLVHFSYSFLADGTARIVELPGEPEPPGPAFRDALHLVPDARADREPAALHGLGVCPGGASPTLSEPALSAIRCAFRSYDFTAALGLGLELLARDADLAPSQRSELYGIIGLSAHNRQFNAQDGGPRFNDFLKQTFGAALAADPSPEHRCALLYRLAVTVGRRMRDCEGALPWADRAVSEAREVRLPEGQRAYLEAWARNIRSYVYLFLKRPHEASSDVEKACALLKEARRLAAEARSPRDLSPRDVTASHAFITHNLAALAHFAGDEEKARSFKRAATDIGAGFSGVERLDAFGWIEIHRGLLRLDVALADALAGLASAASERDPFWEFRYALEAADLCYRLGDATRSREHFLRARDLRLRLGCPDLLVAVDASLAAVCARAGHGEEAAALLEEALSREEPGASGPRHALDPRAQLLAGLGVLAARRGDPVEAERRINDAIDLAVESGERDTLVRIAVAAGQANQVLGRRFDAAESYARALDMTEVPVSAETSAPPPASEILAALVGLQECRAIELTMTLRAVQVVPAALADAEAWWHLPRLLVILVHAAHASPHLPWAEMARPLSTLIAAARLRGDCAAAIRELEDARSRSGLQQQAC